jgi:hypothetical protein
MASSINLASFFTAQANVVNDIYSNTPPMKKLRYPEFFNSFSGDEDRSFWQALSVIGFGLMAVKAEGQAATIDFSKQGILSFFPKVTFALRYFVTKEMAREDKKRIIPKLPALLRYSKDQTYEFLFWNVLNLGFTAAPTGYNVADGLPLFSNAHTCAGNPSLTWSNNIGAVALTVETLNQIFTLMAVMPDDRGLITSRTPEDIWYPVGLHQNVVEVLSSFYYPSTDENRVNSVAGSLTPHAVEYLVPASTIGPFPWYVSAGKGQLGTDSHTCFTNTAWDEQRAYYEKNTQQMIQEVEARLAWGAVTGYGIAASSGA